jgi:hypothetical protein
MRWDHAERWLHSIGAPPLIRILSAFGIQSRFYCRDFSLLGFRSTIVGETDKESAVKRLHSLALGISECGRRSRVLVVPIPYLGTSFEPCGAGAAQLAQSVIHPTDTWTTIEIRDLGEPTFAALHSPDHPDDPVWRSRRLPVSYVPPPLASSSFPIFTPSTLSTGPAGL